ncbi:MAG: hypothetical protein C4536_06265 [Actinobacteria bacterium]|nr:MAG: hypothetical protein C4536_06265 [Actinomycetota bacterium]
MRRRQWPEITDRGWCPALLRDTATDVLRFTSVRTNMYGPIVPRLKSVLEALDCHDIVDLCSGGTGPVLLIQEQLGSRERYPVRVTLTDKWPNIEAFKAAAAQAASRISYVADPVDATDVPEGLRGFRTLFASFHHFRPEEAKKILADAARRGEGIGVFEFTGRNPGIFLIMLLSPLYLLLAMPFIKPFSWRKMFWTYVIPLLPLGTLWEGMASNMRTYSPEELRELIKGIEAADYAWETGKIPGTWDLGRIHGKGWHKITYLLGYPVGPRHSATCMR